MTQPFSLPTSPDEVTPTWLTAVLQEADVLRQRHIVQAHWERIGEAWGFTGILARFYLRYDQIAPEEEAPASLIAKFPTASPNTPSAYLAAQQRTPTAVQQHYARCAREVRFYQAIAPLGQTPTARLYYGAANDTTGRVVLLLQDMRAARAGDVLRGCSPDEAALVLQAIAPFHAQWWAHPPPEALAWLPRWAGDPHARQARYNQQVGRFLARFGQQLPPFVHAVIERLRSGYEPVLTRLAEAPATLIHADLHLDNILFQPPGSAPAVIVLDWQSISSGAGAVDVAQFLFGSLAIEQRRAAADELLQHYHALLVKHGVSDYSLAQLHEHCRLALLWNLAGTVGWLSAVDLDHLSGRERALAQAAFGDGRLVTALKEYDVLALLPR